MIRVDFVLKDESIAVAPLEEDQPVQPERTVLCMPLFVLLGSYDLFGEEPWRCVFVLARPASILASAVMTMQSVE